jgi:hypothetical protein
MGSGRLRGVWRNIESRHQLSHGKTRVELMCGHSTIAQLGVALNEENDTPFDDRMIALFCLQCDPAELDTP